jgi:hypothetical protein
MRDSGSAEKRFGGAKIVIFEPPLEVCFPHIGRYRVVPALVREGLVSTRKRNPAADLLQMQSTEQLTQLMIAEPVKPPVEVDSTIARA